MKYLSLLVLLLVCCNVLLAQNKRTLRGTVTDEKDEPLIGASILLKGSNPIIGAVTDVDGKWTLEIPADGKTLVFSYTGFTTKEMEIGVSDEMNLQLKEGVEIENVVVTAMGISRSEKSLGYSVGQVSGARVAGSGEVNVIQGLAGKVSGIQVIGSGGTPGASSKILIRGNSTFTGNNQPLMVVDGVPYDNQTQSSVADDYPFNSNLEGVNNSNRAVDLNPDDIETVTVLKGPAAAVLYGTRAANGVLMITTKRGKMNNNKPGLNVSFSSNVDISEVNKLPKLQHKYAQGFGGGKMDAQGNPIEQGEYDTYGLDGSGGTPYSWGPTIGQDTFGLTAHDNYKSYFKKGVSYNNNLGISGGNQYSSFRLSYGNTTQQGVVPNTSLHRNTVRLNAQIGTDKFKIIGNASYSNTQTSKAQNGSNLSGVMLALSRMPSSFDMRGGAGPNGYDNVDGSPYTYFDPYDNPLWSAYNNPSTDNINRFTGNMQMQYTPIKDDKQVLMITYRLSADTYNDSRKQVFAIGAHNAGVLTGELWENTKNRIEINSDLLINYSRNVTDDFNFSVTLGNNLNHRRDFDLFTRGRNYTVAGFNNMSNTSNLYASQNTIFKRLAGLFFDINLGYKNMLYLNIAARNDWASTFGSDIRNKGFFYPSASASFVFSELIPANKVLSFGKLRASFAQSGREPDPYGTQTYFAKPFVTDGFTNGLSFPYAGQNAFGYSNGIGNPHLRPEILTGLEVGLDLRFLNGRITFDATYYNQTSSNLLLDRPVATSSGFKSFYVNAGKMRNQGVELELNATVIQTKKFTWDITGNFTMNRNKVLLLQDQVSKIEFESTFDGIGAFAIKGQPYGAIYGSTWERDANNNLIIGADGLPTISSTQKNIGNPYPTWTAGIRNTFSFFGVTIAALLDVRQGGDLWAGTYARLTRLGQTLQTVDRNQTYVIQGVHPDGTANTTAVSALNYFRYYKGDFGATENAIYKGSWFRLRELTVTYQLPLSKVKLLKDASISIFFTGRNLALYTKYPGVDPETSLTGAGSNVTGFDYFNMPNTRSYLVGLKANF